VSAILEINVEESMWTWKQEDADGHKEEEFQNLIKNNYCDRISVNGRDMLHDYG
jgi:hypothetical protein